MQLAKFIRWGRAVDQRWQSLRHLFCCLAAVTLASTILAQVVPREPAAIPGTAAADFGVVDLATHGDVSALGAYDGAPSTGSKVYLATSDGRGLDWSRPIRADEDSSQSWKDQVQVAVLGDKVFIAWRDDRVQGATGVYYNIFDTSSGTLAGEHHLDLVHSEGAAWNSFAIAFTHVDGVPLLYVLLRTSEHNGSQHELYLATSVTAGDTFTDPVLLSPELQGLSIPYFALTARDVSVYIAWADNRHASPSLFNHLFFQRSDQVGVSGFLEEDIQLTNPQEPSGPRLPALDASEDRVAVVWEEKADVLSTEVHCAVSSDHGLSFGDPIRVGEYPPFTIVKRPDVGIDRATGNVIVTWRDNRQLLYDLCWVATSVDGVSFGPDVLMGDEGGLFHTVRVGGSECPDDDAAAMTVVSWTADHSDVDERLFVRPSWDGGVTWGSPAAIFLDEASWVFDSAYNCKYRNFLYAWPDLALETEVTALAHGGFRAPTLSSSGFAPGGSTVSLEFDFFDPATDELAWSLFALNPADVLPVEGKVLGLFPDILFSTSLSAALAGALSSPIDSEGSGALAPFFVNLPPGLTIYGIGLGLDVSGGFPSVGSITDVMEIKL